MDSKIPELVFAGGTTLAGLVLMFLGFIVTSFEALSLEEQEDAQATAKRRGRRVLIAFFASLLAAVCALAWFVVQSAALYYLSVFLLLTGFIETGYVAGRAVVFLRPDDWRVRRRKHQHT